jgi:hypothetical protein
VKARCTVRNDGTFAGKDIGEILVKKGEEGYVVSIGTFLQQFYIYGVEFIASGHRVGMKRKELEPAGSSATKQGVSNDRAGVTEIQWGQRVRACLDLYNDGSFPDSPPEALLARSGDVGEIVQVGTHTDSRTSVYLVAFAEHRVVGCLEQEIAAL